MAYDLWTKTQTGHDYSIGLPTKTAAGATGSWLSDHAKDMVPWKKVLLVSGVLVGGGLLASLISREEQHSSRLPIRTIDDLEKTQRVPLHEPMRKIVEQGLR